MMAVVTQQWTYGAEHELGDWDRTKPLPDGFAFDPKDVTVMNSNGTAADPKGLLPPYGGEINTPPTPTPIGQVGALIDILERYPNACVNHRSNLHVHIRVPGLRDDLDLLKSLALFCHRELPRVLELVEPVPEPTLAEYPDPEEYQGAVRRYRRRLVSHHTVVTEARLQKQLAAHTFEDFMAAECSLDSRGRPMWHLAARAAVNLRHLREATDTIEFRHFPGTLLPHELLSCVDWCRDFLAVGLGLRRDVLDAVELFNRHYRHRSFPRFPKYDHQLELRYRATCHDGTNSRQEIASAIHAIERGEFHP